LKLELYPSLDERRGSAQTDILFAFLMNKLAWNDGIYNYYIEHGWPRVPFAYEHVTDLPERMMNVLLEGHEQEDFRRAAKMAFLMFGRAPAPPQVETLAGTYLNDVSKSFEALRQEAKSVFESPRRVE
jgi:hypothetical protein